MEYLLMAVSVAIGVTGFFLARKRFLAEPNADERTAKNWKGIYALLSNKYYIDEVYRALFIRSTVQGSEKLLFRIFDVRIIDGIVNGLARLIDLLSGFLRRIQTGVIPHYAMIFVVGILLVLGILIL